MTKQNETWEEGELNPDELRCKDWGELYAMMDDLLRG